VILDAARLHRFPNTCSKKLISRRLNARSSAHNLEELPLLILQEELLKNLVKESVRELATKLACKVDAQRV